MERDELLEVLKEIERLAESGMAGHMWDALVEIAEKARKAVEDARQAS